MTSTGDKARNAFRVTARVSLNAFRESLNEEGREISISVCGRSAGQTTAPYCDVDLAYTRAARAAEASIEVFAAHHVSKTRQAIIVVNRQMEGAGLRLPAWHGQLEHSLLRLRASPVARDVKGTEAERRDPAALCAAGLHVVDAEQALPALAELRAH